MVRVLFCASAFAVLALAAPTRWKDAIIKRGAEELLDEYDYIVVGAGTAGATVGDRLSEDGKYTVLMIEYGRAALDASFLTPFNSPSREFLWNLTSIPQPHAGNRTFPVANGCVVGGGSAVNGQLHNRGSAHDYDNWARVSGFSGWDWKGMYPYFKKSASLRVPSQETQDKYGVTYDVSAWDQTTPVYASYPTYQYPGQSIIWESWKNKERVVTQKEHADGHAYGLFWIPTAMDAEKAFNRSFGGQAHWFDVQPRENYHLLPEHKVVKVEFENDDGEDGLLSAVSVLVRPRYGNSTSFSVRAKKEIILSAAATRTPQILQLSGIGPKAVVEAANITSLIDLPGVGWNLQDHSFSMSAYNFTQNVWPDPTTININATFRAEALAQYNANNTGPYTSYVVTSGVYLPAQVFMGGPGSGTWTRTLAAQISGQNAEEYLPQGLAPELVAGYAAQKKVLYDSFVADDSAIFEHLFSGGPRGTAILLKPFSRGVIKINPADPEGDLIFDYRLLSNPVDLAVHVRMQQYLREHFKTSKYIAPLGPVELDPGPSLPSDEDVENWLVKQAKILASNGHSTGTAAMMPRELGGVVDGELRIYGTKGLSIADMSIAPLIPGAHTMTTAYAIGEKAADLIKARNA